MTCKKVNLAGVGVVIVCGARPRKKRGPMASVWPMTGAEVKAAGYVSSGRGPCRGCGVQMIWTTTPKGNKMPLTMTADGKYERHFASCPKRGQFKKADK